VPPIRATDQRRSTASGCLESWFEKLKEREVRLDSYGTLDNTDAGSAATPTATTTGPTAA